VIQGDNRTFDPIQVEVWRHLLASIAEEMGATLERTAYSPNIKERLDHSCAVFDAEGRLLAQAAHIPVHLGAMPLMLQTLRKQVTWSPGRMWLCNDPRIGGTHLPDLTLVAPVYSIHRFHDEMMNKETGKTGKAAPDTRATGPGHQKPDALIGYVASRAHHADIGGISPGSLPLSTELFQEGLVLPPIRLVERGKVREDLLRLVCANSRTPAERRGDLSAQIAANETGIRRLQAMVERYGRAEFSLRTAENIAYAARAVQSVLTRLPAGSYTALDYLDDDGVGTRDILLTVTVTIQSSGRIGFDFTGSAPQVKGSLNATEAITRSACYYIVRCLIEDEIPTNEGCFLPVEVIAPEGSIVNARFPAAVAGGNVETSQRIVDVLIKALSQVAPDRIPAASQGTMNNLTIGGYDRLRQQPFAYYETIAGGAGASPKGSGLHAVHTHMTNTRNTPVEALESHYPLRVLDYSILEGTGGEGEHRGGNGLSRQLELLQDAHLSILSERRCHPPFGVNGGGAGAEGRNSLQLPAEQEQALPGKWSRDCPAGAIITICTPGGGAWGNPGKLRVSEENG
jgi:N-methylhydantoinase B